MYNCKFCFIDDKRENLISPCLCSGNIKYVHRECLDKWRLTNLNNQNFYACEVCKNKFILETDKFFGFLTKIIFATKILLFNFLILGSIFLLGKLFNLLNIKNIIIVNNTYINDFLFGLIILSIFTALIFYIIFCQNNLFGQYQQRNILYFLSNNFFLLSISIIGFIILVYYMIKLQILIIKNYNYHYTDKYIVKDLDK